MKKTLSITSILILLLVLPTAYLYSQTNTRSAGTINQPNQNNINLTEAINKLKKTDYFISRASINAAILNAFAGMEKSAINYAINILRSPRIEIIGKERINRSEDYYIAKIILQQFSNDSIFMLENEYKMANPVFRGNIIESLPMLDNIETTGKLLFEALADTSFCEEESVEMEGIPLRVCDKAYNQQVLQYQIKDVLRAIGPMHKIEIRDYHIAILKDKIAQLNIV